MYVMHSQHHLSRVKSRDAQITSLSQQLQLEGYGEAPFSAETVKQFLSKADQTVRGREERARQEKVSNFVCRFLRDASS